MGDLSADRVYDQRASRQLVFAATGMGVAVIETAGDMIGRFRLVHECEARDLAGGGGWVAVATPEDVLACEVVSDEGGTVDQEDDADGEDDADEIAEWIETGFGPAVAVGVDRGDLLAARPDGELGRVVDVAADPTDWLTVADVDGAVRAIDGPLVGASDGVYRFTPDGLFDVGLDDVRDVSAAGVPLAATGDGLFRLANGWLREVDGAVDVVAGTDRPAWDGESDRDGSSDDDATDHGSTDDGAADDGATDDSPAHDSAAHDGSTDGSPADDGSTGSGQADPEPAVAGDALARGHAAARDQLYEYHGARTRERRREAGGEPGDSAARIPERDAGGASRDASGPGEVDVGDVPDDGDSNGFDDEIVSPAVAARAWRERSTPVGPVVAVAHGQRTYALAADGTFLLDRGDEWTTRATGLPDVVALATPQ